MLARLSKRIKAPGEPKGWMAKSSIDGVEYFFNTTTGELSWEKPQELLSKEERDAGSSKWVWVPHPEHVWQPARVVKDKGDTVEVKTEAGKKATVLRDQVMSDTLTGGRDQMVPLWDLNYSSLKRPEQDLVMLDSHNEAMLVHTLRMQYNNDQLYVWVGAGHSVLIAVNPYKNLPLYGPEVIDRHANRPPNVALAPHVYDIAKGAYEDLVYGKKNQSILISGESGAGKTVCTKQALNFLASVAGSESSVEEKVIMANPLLEAFGNAQTVRNNNSSRFGKYIDIHFDASSGAITAAHITNYLLEKSRVVTQQAGERNYHVFYQLTNHGATKSKLGLKGPEAYAYLTKSGTMKAKDIDDKEAHDEVLEALSVLDFSDEERDFVLRLTAGVLLLGNVAFNSKSLKDGVTGSTIKDGAAVAEASKFLGVSEDDLAHVLCHRSISVRGKTSTIPLDPAAARKGCDSLAMGVYSRLFTYLVTKVNAALDGDMTGRTIGILDIYGFEIFDNNSFEQLLINFTNEALQQQFNRTTFKEEEKVYETEGIDFQHVEFIDNQVVLDLIQAKPHGILLMIDDEIKIPQGSEPGFMNKVETMYKRHPKFQTDKHRRLENSLNFEIEHYAGIVCYNAEGFMEKNTDTLFQDAYDLLSTSSHGTMGELFPNEETRRQLVSLSTQFRRSLNELMDALSETESRYIRCIKPNDEQRPNQFQARRVLEQLRYSGVFEAVEIRSRGFPFRLTYSVFACRYSCINYGVRHKNTDDEEALVKEILATSKQDFREVRFGRTLVLYRAPEYKLLELMRNLALETIIPKQEALVRGGIARSFTRKCLEAQAAIQAALDVGNDIDMLDEALAAVEPTIGPELRALFPNGRPANLKKAKAHRANLAKWKALESRLEKLVTKDPNSVYYDLAEAVEEGKSLMHIPQTSRQRELIDEAMELRANSELGKIDAVAEEVLANLYREELEDLSRRAKERGHRTPVLEEINKRLRLPLIDYVELEIEVATEQGDDKRRIHRTILRDQLWLDDHEAQYTALHKANKLKDPVVYGKTSASGLAKLLGSGQKRADTMLVWTKAVPACTLQELEDVDKPTMKGLMVALKQARIYAGDAKPGKTTPDQAASDFVAFAKATSADLLDELYLQTLKQTQHNETPESVTAYWDLLLLLLGTRLPGEEVERLVLTMAKKDAPDGFHAKAFTSAARETKYGRASASVSKVSDMRSADQSRWSYKAPKPAADDDDEE